MRKKNPGKQKPGRPLAPPAATTGRLRLFPPLITLLFFLVALLGLIHHECWRDEFQAWMVARESHSLPQLFHNMRYEGHPFLYFLILYGLTSITTAPFALQCLNLAFATGAVWLVSAKAPWTVLQKALFALSYYVLYEFTVITRYHALALLLVTAFCVLYANRRRNFPWLILLLVLLANISLFINAISIALAGFLFIDYISHRKTTAWQGLSAPLFATGMGIFLAAVLFSAWQILPEDDNMIRPDVTSLWNPVWLQALLSRVSNAYLLFRDIETLPKWLAVGWIQMDKENIPLHFWLSILLIAVLSAGFLRRPAALFLFLAGHLGLLVLYGVSMLTAARYMSSLFVIYFCAQWLSSFVDALRPQNALIRSLAAFGEKARSPLFTLILLAQVVAAGAFYLTDWTRPFSASRDAASYIKQQHLDTLPVAGTVDYCISPLAAFLDQPLYYPEIRDTGSFIFWSNHRKEVSAFSAVAELLDSLAVNGKALLVTSYPLNQTVNGQSVPIEKGRISPTLQIRWLKSFGHSMVSDENYYLYLAEKVQ
jgi:hypothetical protein